MCVDAYIESKHELQELPPEYLENQRNLQRLALFILLRQAALTFSIRYHDSLQNRLNGVNAEKLGQYVAYRLMKKLLAELRGNPQQLPSVETLVNYFLTSIQKSGLFHTEDLTLEPLENMSHLRIAALSRKIPIKQFCARQRWIVIEGSDIKIYGAETNPFHDHFQFKTTREDLGSIPITPDNLSDVVLAIDKARFHELAIPVTHIHDLVKKCLFPYPVSRQEIADYQLAYQTNNTLTLNAYLSQLHNRPIIACCHDDELRGMVLVGNYSNVNFYEADLSDCDFSDANFSHANLCRASMLRILTSPRTIFQHLLAEGSTWTGESANKVVIQGDISHGKFNGSTWKHCQLDTRTIQIGSEWNLAVLCVFRSGRTAKTVLLEHLLRFCPNGDFGLSYYSNS